LVVTVKKIRESSREDLYRGNKKEVWRVLKHDREVSSTTFRSSFDDANFLFLQHMVSVDIRVEDGVAGRTFYPELELSEDSRKVNS
jgi:hypothetical protein